MKCLLVVLDLKWSAHSSLTATMTTMTVNSVVKATESHVDSMPPEFYLASKSSFFTDVAYALLLRAMLKNKVKILLLSFCASYGVTRLFDRSSYKLRRIR